MTVITMSRNQLTRLPVLIDVADGRLSVADATGLIGVGRKQVYRVMDAFRAHGADGVISRKRGGPSNRALGAVWREERTVSNSLTLQYDKVLFLLEPNEITRELRRQRVTVVDYPDGRLAIRYHGLDLPYTTFDKLRQVSQEAIVENKHLGAALAFIREQQRQTPQQRSQKAPRRQGQVNHMFKVG